MINIFHGSYSISLKLCTDVFRDMMKMCKCFFEEKISYSKIFFKLCNCCMASDYYKVSSSSTDFMLSERNLALTLGMYLSVHASLNSGKNIFF